MKNLANIEVFNIEITEKGTFAHISFQDLDNTDNLNNGYDNIRVPMNLRPIQKSVRDNVLVDQSVKNYEDKKYNIKVFDELFSYAWGLAEYPEQYSKLNEIYETK